MPEIKIKHVASFSSEDKVHKAENLLKDETYRKWKCATPGEKNATVVLQFEKATKIHSIDIGNEGSAFVEVLVGRSSDSVNDYQVLLVASSFMSPLESRTGTHTNRVRMFGPEKLAQNIKDEKWDCVQIVCTQPFNKNMQYGLTFIKFHSPPEKIEEQPRTEKHVSKLGAFKLKAGSDSDDSLPPLGSFFGKQKSKASESSSDSAANQGSLSYATAILNSSSSSSSGHSQDISLKRKAEDKCIVSQEPSVKKTSINKEHIVYKDVLRDSPESKKPSGVNKNDKKDTISPKIEEKKKQSVQPALNKQKDIQSPKIEEKKKESNSASNKQAANNTPVRPSRQKVPFDKIMDKVVFVLSGFVNPLRSDLREKALDMGAKYKADWDSTCTHLVCAFANTPKYQQVKKANGRIVSKEWILDCYKRKEPILWRRYELSSGDSSDDNDDSDKDPNYNAAADDEESDADIIDESDDDKSDTYVIEESEDDDDNAKKKKKRQRKNQKQKAANPSKKKSPQSSNDKNNIVKNAGTVNNNSLLSAPKRKMNMSDSEDEPNTPKQKKNVNIFSKLKKLHRQDELDNLSSPSIQKADESETEDEDAIQDYIADTDVESDSCGGTEDEIRKVEEKARKKKLRMNVTNKDEYSEKPDVSDLPLPDLPDFFKKRRFFLYGDFSPSKLHELQRYITAYNGVLEDYMGDKVKYVITEKKWDKNFDDALNANEDLIFVKPTWIYKCHEAKKVIPYQPHIVIPDT